MNRLVAIITFIFLPTCHGLADESGKHLQRPNIVFILLDNVGKDWLRSYGSQENQTPNIDRLCNTGMKFRNFYVTPVCSTTRTMLLTGRYPFRTGWHTHHDSAIYGGGFLDWDREICVARLLRDSGYKTCISGKWQINDLFDPNQQDALQNMDSRNTASGRKQNQDWLDTRNVTGTLMSFAMGKKSTPPVSSGPMSLPNTRSISCVVTGTNPFFFINLQS